MGDFIALGLEGADLLIDKHFHKVPDKYVDPKTYKPNRLRRGSKDQQQQSPSPRHKDKHHHERRSSSPPYPDPERGMADDRPRNGANSSPYLQDGPFITPPLYSQLPPHQRPEYTPSPPPIGVAGGFYPPPPQSQALDRHSRDRRRTYDDDDYYHSPPPRRPTALRRRSSSYHGPRGDDYFYSDEEDKQVVHRPRRSGSHADIGDKMRDKAHRYGLKEEITNQFTKSKEGLAGGVVGALVGGWATHKALESKGRDHGSGDAALTLLGAAVGGLAANAVVDKWEDGKRETREKEARWEEKWDGDDGYDDRRCGSGRSRRDSRRHDDGYYR